MLGAMTASLQFRFGLGPAPAAAAPPGPAAQLAGPDLMAARFPAPSRLDLFEVLLDLRAARQMQPRDPVEVEIASAAMEDAILSNQRRLLARALDTPSPYRERLVRFWSSHFSVTARQRLYRPEAADLTEAAIRPHVAAPFGSMLRAAILHPAMQRYLDNANSFGPNSRAGRNRNRGVNENLGRELLELHTLGAGGPYTQADVRAAALLLTGHGIDRGDSTFNPNRAEPGVQTVLGRSYGSMARSEHDITALLDDLAVHPATAAHLARKLAVHFVADDPPPDLVADLTRVWLDSGGDLARVSVALAEHPLALDAPPAKIRPPFEYLAAGLRALGVTGDQAMAWPLGRLRRVWLQPQVQMGQNWQGAPSPAGWPEGTTAWLTAPALAARIDWAMDAPARALGQLPDARDLVETALAGRADDRLRRLVAAAESNIEGVGLVLASPAFQRR